MFTGSRSRLGFRGAVPPLNPRRDLSGPSPAPKRHVLEQQVEVLDRPSGPLPGPLLHLVLPVRIDAPALDPPPEPPLLILERRRRQRLAEQVLDALEAERHLLLPLRQ